MNKSKSARKSSSARAYSKNGKNSSAKNESDRHDEYKLYEKIRKAADLALRDGDYVQSRILYVKGAEEVAALKIDKEQRISLMYAGAASSAMRCSKYLLAIKHLRQSFDTMNEKEYWFIPTLNYVTDLIHTLPYYLKTKAQQQELRKLRRDMFSRFKAHLQNLSKPVPKPIHKKYKLHNQTIIDNYSYLEDGDSKHTKEWLQAQREYCKSVMQLALLNYELPSEYFRPDRQQENMIPYRYGKYYYFRSTNFSTRHKIIRRSVSLSRKPQVILSGADACPEEYFVTAERLSEDGKYIAFGMSKHGSDWEEWRVKNVSTGKDIHGLRIHVRHGSVMFHPNNKGLFYWKQTKPKQHEDKLQRVDKSVRIYYRPLKKGTRETLLYAPKDKTVDRVGFQFILDDKWALIQERKKGETKSRVYLRCESDKSKKLIPLFGTKLCDISYIGFVKDTFFLHSFDGAKNGKVVALTLDKKKMQIIKVETVVPESKYVMTDVHLLKDRFIVNYLIERSTRSLLVSVDFNGKEIGKIALPFPGIVDNLSTNFDDANLFFTLSNFSNALTIYKHNVKSGKTILFMAPSGSPCRDLKTEVVEVKSKDGAVVPMWLVYRNSVKPSAKTPTLMMVYGGFNVPCVPYCNYEIISWTEMGGIWAQPYLRGGGELGQHWHEDARKLGKQKTFDDAIACAQYLIKNKYTSAKKLAIKGGSNGGLTVAAVLNQAPEHFAAGVSSNGLLDMLKFENKTIGWAWESEYGSVRKQQEFKVLKSYSPYHNVRQRKNFPAVLLCASSGDDRVPPWNSYKYAAALSEKNKNGSLVLLRVEDESGHHNPRSSWEVRDQQAFLKLILDF